MAVLSLPLTFQNSFWSQDYRTGLEVLYTQLEKGVLENEEVVAFIRARAAAESALASSLTAAGPAGKAFARDDGATLHVAFRGLKEESIAQGKAHEAIAAELRDSVAAPFEKWAHGYRERLWNNRHNMLDGFMHSYEAAQLEVTKLKQDYLNKMRRADEAEDDARFAPIPQNVGDNFTTSPSMLPRDKPRLPTRTPTMTERISQRFKELRLQAGGATSPDKSEVHFDADADSEKGTPKLDKGKGRAVESPERMVSPPPMSSPLPPARLNTNPAPPPPAPPMMIAGLEMAPADVSALLKRAAEQMPLRPVRFPLLGEYSDCFSGEDFASWLKENVKDFSGSLDHAAFAAKELTEKHNLLRRVGEFGNDYENADDAFYQFRTKAFELGMAPAHPENAVSPIQKSLSPMAEAVAARTTTIASLVSKALNANGTAEPPHIRARREADTADRDYRIAVRKLDRQRLGLEERVEETLKTLQKWELDRLRAVKTVLRQYQTAVAKLAKAYEPSLERSNLLIDSYAPEADLKVFIEQNRTGPFRPEPRVYESVTHDESDVVFGIDLRRWADSGMWPGSEEKKDKPDIPPVFTLMLSAVHAAYDRLPSDIERRKTWIYDVPLPAVHHVREALNAVPPEQPFPEDILAKYDAPVLAGAIKLWALELNPPLGMYEGWDELRKLYPTVGSNKAEESHSEDQHILELQAALQRLPRVHLLTLDALVKHLKELIANTPAAETDESNEVYVTKLALTMGRTILRPRQETEITIQDRHPTLLFIDLINKYDSIVPPAIERKKRESQRKTPVRRRTRPIDMRMSRSRISAGADLKELQAEQLAQRTGLKMSRGASPRPSSVSSLPVVPASPNPLSPESQDSSIMKSAEPGESFTPPPPPPVAQPAEVAAPESFSNIPPPPPLTKTPTPEVPPPPPLEKPAQPPHPVFKEPPPETDDFPPRPPFFKEPPPEDEPDLPMPSFQPPPAAAPEPAPAPAPVSPPISPPVSAPKAPVAVPSALRARAGSRPGSPRVSSQESSRSPSPSKPSSPTGASLARGSRASRGPRTSAAGSVSSMVNNFNRQSQNLERSSSPGLNGGSGLRRNGSRPGGHAKVGSVARVNELSRRTMASDAEDEVVER